MIFQLLTHRHTGTGYIVATKICVAKQMAEYSMHFTDAAKATAYLHSQAFDALWYHLEKYIHHADSIISNSEHIHSMAPLAAIEKCRAFLEWIPTHKNDLPKLLNAIIKYEPHLKNILPAPQNNSYTTSLERYELILSTAHDCMQWVYKQAA